MSLFKRRKTRATKRVETANGILEVPADISDADLAALRRKFAKEQDDARKETRA